MPLRAIVETTVTIVEDLPDGDPEPVLQLTLIGDEAEVRVNRGGDFVPVQATPRELDALELANEVARGETRDASLPAALVEPAAETAAPAGPVAYGGPPALFDPVEPADG